MLINNLNPIQAFIFLARSVYTFQVDVAFVGFVQLTWVFVLVSTTTAFAKNKKAY